MGRKESSEMDQSLPQEEQLLGSRLKEAREFLGLSQEEVATATGIARVAISAMEVGRRKVNSLELRQLAALYRRDYEFFFKSDVKDEDEAVAALFRATDGLSDQDRQQVLRFAEFLRHSGKPPGPASG